MLIGQFSAPISKKIPPALIGQFFLGAALALWEKCYAFLDFLYPKIKEVNAKKRKFPMAMMARG